MCVFHYSFPAQAGKGLHVFVHAVETHTASFALVSVPAKTEPHAMRLTGRVLVRPDTRVLTAARCVIQVTMGTTATRHACAKTEPVAIQ